MMTANGQMNILVLIGRSRESNGQVMIAPYQSVIKFALVTRDKYGRNMDFLAAIVAA